MRNRNDFVKLRHDVSLPFGGVAKNEVIKAGLRNARRPFRRHLRVNEEGALSGESFRSQK
jgi:hypothetical protein